MSEEIKNDNIISDEALAAAKEKLACHIQPPGAHQSKPQEPSDASCGSSCSIQPAGGLVRLTQMTSAGG
ncbi:MAG: hypothetical protein IKE85_08275 [Mogibacterium sp.]|nr:hypothetical protein [Mogibacterium sp.]